MDITKYKSLAAAVVSVLKEGAKLTEQTWDDSVVELVEFAIVRMFGGLANSDCAEENCPHEEHHVRVMKAVKEEADKQAVPAWVIQLLPVILQLIQQLLVK